MRYAEVERGAARDDNYIQPFAKFQLKIYIHYSNKTKSQ